MKAQRAVQSLKNQPEVTLDAMMSILRTYIQEVYQIRAPHLTTEEFLQEMISHPLFVGKKGQMLAQFLRECDVLRFGGIPVPPAQAAQELRQLQKLLN